MSEMNLNELKSYIRNVMATLLPGAPNELEYIVFKILFLKRLSDRFDEEVEQLIKNEDIAESSARERKELHDFFIPPKAHWSNVKKQTQNLDEAINKALKLVEQENENILSNTLSRSPINEYMSEQSARMLTESISEKKFYNRELKNPEIVGEAFDWLIETTVNYDKGRTRKFNSVTPIRISQLLVYLLEPQQGEQIYNPFLRLGGMMVYSDKYVSGSRKCSDDIEMYVGCPQHWRVKIANMRMILHDISEVNWGFGHPLVDSQFVEGGNLKKFDRVVAHPKWNRSKWGKALIEDESNLNHFEYGQPSKRSDDWSWVQHVIASTKQTGKSAIVLDPGALFRGDEELEVRRNILKEDLVEAVIALPKDIFYGTSVRGCILVFNKNKSKEREGKVLFINAGVPNLSESGVSICKEDRNTNANILTKEGVGKIVDTFKGFVEEPHHSKVASLSEIEENGWDLSVPRYLDTTWQTGRSWSN